MNSTYWFNYEIETNYASFQMNFTQEEYERFLRDEANTSVISSIGVPTLFYLILLVIGFTGNVVNVAVFTRPSMKSPSNFLLASLEAINIVGFCTYVPYIVYDYAPSGHLSLAWALTEYTNVFVISFAMSASNWLTVTVSIFRVIAISAPLASVKLCSKRRAVRSLIAVLFLSLLISVPLLYANQIRKYDVNVIRLVNQSESALQLGHESLLLFETYFYFCIGDTKLASEETTTRLLSVVFQLETTIPCLMTVMSTAVLLVNLWRASRRRKRLNANAATMANRDGNEAKITIMLLVIMVLYVLAILPSAIVNAVLLTSPDDDIWFSYVMNLTLSRIGVLITNSVTFFVYLSMSDKFRMTLKEIIGPGKGRPLFGAKGTLETAC